MIFLPNKFEKYAAGLRNVFQNLILKNGIKPKYLVSLSKIYENEVIFSDLSDQPVNSKKFFSLLLFAIYYKKLALNKFIQFSCNTNGNYLLDKKAIAIFLLKIAQKSSFIEIFQKKGKFLIRTNFTDQSAIRRIAEKLEIITLKEIKNNIFLFILPLNKTEKEEKDSEENFFSLQNPLSLINCYLFD